MSAEGSHTKGREVWFVSEVGRFLRAEIEEATDEETHARLEQSLANFVCGDRLLREGSSEEAAHAEANLRFPPLYSPEGVLRSDLRSLLADPAARHALIGRPFTDISPKASSDNVAKLVEELLRLGDETGRGE